MPATRRVSYEFIWIICPIRTAHRKLSSRRNPWRVQKCWRGEWWVCHRLVKWQINNLSIWIFSFYQNIGDIEQALQFLIMCGCTSDAFVLAQRHNKLRQYAEVLENSENAQPSNYLDVAQHFEREKYTLLAGKYYFFAKEYSKVWTTCDRFPNCKCSNPCAHSLVHWLKALKHLLKASSFNNDENIALSLAIDCVASSNDGKLANQLIEFLLGEVDGSPKDPKFLFGLYMARKQFKEAAKTAIIISNQEQIGGNYRTAHDLLFSMYQVSDSRAAATNPITLKKGNDDVFLFVCAGITTE